MQIENIRRKVLPANTVGVDYYIGDLHGRYDLLMRLLAAINFNKDVDRLISVGDLIDRGPQSRECLELLREPWFFAVLANHEEMMWMAFLDQNDPRFNWRLAESWFGNGGTWALEDWSVINRSSIPTDAQADLAQLVRENVGDLPHMLHVEQCDGHFIHVVHAELPRNRHYTAVNLQDQDFMQRIYNLSFDTRYGTCGFRWDRFMFGPLYQRSVMSATPELQRISHNMSTSEELIISGHTICKQPVMIDNFLNIDTGAYKGGAYGLTCYNSQNNSFIMVKDDSIVFDMDVAILSIPILKAHND